MAPPLRIYGIAGLVLVLTGCWTGQLIESARTHESVLTYQRISIDGDELRVDYVAEVTRDLSGKHDETPPMKLRAASFSIDALTHRPALPVDEFPLRRIRPGSGGGKPIRFGGNPVAPSYPHVDLKSPNDELIAKLSVREERHLGFGLCPAAGDECLGFFHSAALYQDRISWWAYPAAPFAIILDLALLPIQIFTLPPLIALSD